MRCKIFYDRPQYDFETEINAFLAGSPATDIEIVCVQAVSLPYSNVKGSWEEQGLNCELMILVFYRVRSVRQSTPPAGQW